MQGIISQCIAQSLEFGDIVVEIEKLTLFGR